MKKIVFLVIASLLMAKILSTNIIFKYCVVHSFSPKGPQGDYINPYSNFNITLSTVEDPADYQQPDLSDFNNVTYLYLQQNEIDTEGSSTEYNTPQTAFKGDVSNKSLRNFCPNEANTGVPTFSSPFIFWVVNDYCDEANNLLYPQGRVSAHFTFVKTEFEAYSKFIELSKNSSKYHLIGWSPDGTFKTTFPTNGVSTYYVGGSHQKFMDYSLDLETDDICDSCS